MADGHENQGFVEDVTTTLDAFHISDTPQPAARNSANVNPFDKAGIHSGMAQSSHESSPESQVSPQNQDNSRGTAGALKGPELTLEERRERRQRRRQQLQAMNADTQGQSNMQGQGQSNMQSQGHSNLQGQGQSNMQGQGTVQTSIAYSTARLPHNGSDITAEGACNDVSTARLPHNGSDITAEGACNDQSQGQRSRRRYITRDQEGENDPKLSSLPLPTGTELSNSGNHSNSRRIVASDNLLPSRPVIATNNSAAASEGDSNALSHSQKWRQRQQSQGHNESFISDQSPGSVRSNDTSLSSNDGTPLVVRQRRARSMERMRARSMERTSQADREVPPALARLSQQNDQRNSADPRTRNPNYNSCDNKERSLPEQAEVTIQNTEASAGNVLAKLQSTL